MDLSLPALPSYTQTHTQEYSVFLMSRRCLHLLTVAGCLAWWVGCSARQHTLTQRPGPSLRCQALFLSKISSSGMDF